MLDEPKGSCEGQEESAMDSLLGEGDDIFDGIEDAYGNSGDTTRSLGQVGLLNEQGMLRTSLLQEELGEASAGLIYEANFVAKTLGVLALKTFKQMAGDGSTALLDNVRASLAESGMPLPPLKNLGFTIFVRVQPKKPDPLFDPFTADTSSPQQHFNTEPGSYPQRTMPAGVYPNSKGVYNPSTGEWSTVMPPSVYDPVTGVWSRPDPKNKPKPASVQGEFLGEDQDEDTSQLLRDAPSAQNGDIAVHSLDSSDGNLVDSSDSTLLNMLT